MAPPTNNPVASFLKDLKKKHKKKTRDRKEFHKSHKKEHEHVKEKKRKQPTQSDNVLVERPSKRQNKSSLSKSPLTFPIRYMCAPMVGASELAFRLLCRKYGCETAYTPMMSAHEFAIDRQYRKENFQTCAQDRPLVCHFSANTPADFSAAAVQAAPYCDAIDLNLGCPQRGAFLNHFGSYLLDLKDRQLLCDMVKAAAAAVDVPIFCKIRLLNSLADTVELVRQLRDAGASLIAIHGRKRATWERKGAGARDGPALLDQVAAVKQQVPNVAIVTNGNTKTWQDVEDNLESTETEGLMSAEGLLDNPALFLGRYGSREEPSKHVAVPDALASSSNEDKQKNKLQKLLRKIQRIERKVASKGQSAMSIEDKERLSTKVSVQASLAKLDAPIADEKGALPAPGGQVSLSLGSLYESSDDKVQLTLEYLDLATKFPVVIRSVIFHTRRILKNALDQYQLMEECLACQTLQQVREIVLQIRGYQADPASFVYDREKAKQEKEALERKRREEGKRKEYEARMMRKAKREGKSDLMHYLNIGAEVPTEDIIAELKCLPKAELMASWKKKHSQHCLAFHMEPGGCQRGRTCAFLHVDLQGGNAFVEKDEVAG